MFNLIQLFYSGNLILLGQVYFSPARLIFSGQIRPLKPGNRKLHSRETSWARTGYVPAGQTGKTGHWPDLCSPAGLRPVTLVGGGETGCFPMSRSRKQNVLLTRQLAVEERLAGWWVGGWRSRASSLSGAGTIAIVLFQDCELKMLELLGAQQKAPKDFSSFLKLKTWRKLRVLVRRSRSRAEEYLGPRQSSY